MPSLYVCANDVALFAQRKIVGLQRAYVGKGPGAADARASLARLRRLGTPGSSWVSVGEELFDGLLELRLSNSHEAKALRAIAAALQLYAYHQQSKDRPMAMVGAEGDSRSHRCSFGWSCRHIEYDKDKSKGVRRRMAAMEGIRDIDGVLHHMRALIELMKNNDVRVDYYLLGRDLFLMQFASARGDVFMRWGRDYFTAPAQDGPEDAKADTSDDDKNEEALHAES